jgi:hypothetical protein
MRRDEILKILVDWNYWGNYKDESVERGRYIENLNHLLKTGEVMVIKGVRRSGKSTLMLQYIRKSGLEAKNTLVVNFEDPRFKNLNLELLDKIYEVYQEELQPDREHYVILDEVQEVEGWEKFARYLHEAKKVQVFITGSSSKLLSEEYSTLLAGRHVDIEIFPLCFSEFLDFKGVSIRSGVEMIKFRHRIRKLLDEYLEFGSFPKVALIEEGKEELLNNYFRDILIKDVQSRFKVREPVKLEELAKYYLTNIGTLQSFNRVRKLLNLSLDTVERYSKYFTVARLIFFVPKFSFSVREQILNPKKVYCVDTGLRDIVSFKFSEDLGRIVENVVFLNLLFRNKEIYYWKDKQQREVDFVLKSGLEIEQLIQVTYASNEEEIEVREKKALIKASEELNCEDMRVITWDYEAEEEFKGEAIKFVPLWKWLLEDNGK